MVIGQDGAVVFVRHGGILVKVRSSRLNKVNRQQQEKQTVQDNTNNETKDEGSNLNKTAVGEKRDKSFGLQNEPGLMLCLIHVVWHQI